MLGAQEEEERKGEAEELALGSAFSSDAQESAYPPQETVLVV